MLKPDQTSRIASELQSHAMLVVEEETGDVMLAARTAGVVEQAIISYLNQNPNIGGFRPGSGRKPRYPYGVSARPSIIVPKQVHAKLKELAKKEKVSVNQLCNRLIVEYVETNGR